MNSLISKTTDLTYGTIATMLGFLTHPYQTMQKVVEKHVPMPLIFFPAVFCFIGWFVARDFSWFFLGVVPLFGMWWFLEVWWLTLWSMWQVTLLYLFWRFSSNLS
jgi:hypothetical protein